MNDELRDEAGMLAEEMRRAANGKPYTAPEVFVQQHAEAALVIPSLLSALAAARAEVERLNLALNGWEDDVQALRARVADLEAAQGFGASHWYHRFNEEADRADAALAENRDLRAAIAAEIVVQRHLMHLTEYGERMLLAALVPPAAAPTEETP